MSIYLSYFMGRNKPFTLLDLKQSNDQSSSNSNLTIFTSRISCDVFPWNMPNSRYIRNWLIFNRNLTKLDSNISPERQPRNTFSMNRQLIFPENPFGMPFTWNQHPFRLSAASRSLIVNQNWIIDSFVSFVCREMWRLPSSESPESKRIPTN